MNHCVKYVISTECAAALPSFRNLVYPKSCLRITLSAVQTAASFSINKVYFVPLAQLSMAAVNHDWVPMESAF